MKHITLQQGTPEWHAHRAAHYNASDAPAMLGQSPYKSRAELVKQYATGIVPEVDPAAQRRFDDGHRFEALARPLAEEIIGEELYPVTGVLEGSRLSASFDGLTMLEDVASEHKTLNDGLRAALVDRATGANLPLHYQIQMEQQCMVSDCEKVLFMASQWDAEGILIEERHCWYTPNPEIRQQIIAGWELFEQDVAAYRAEQADVSQHRPAGRAPQTLPALHIEARGQVLASNLDAFRSEAKAVFDSINRNLVTDADFADAEKTVKWCKQVEDKMASAKDAVLGQMADVDAVCRMLDDVAAESKVIRLELDKLVKVEKDTRKQQIVMAAQDKLASHVRMLNDSLGAQWVQLPIGRFAEAIKGLKTLESMQDKVSGALAMSMAETTATAERLQANHSVTQDGADWSFLFADFATVGLNEPETFQAIAAQRIAKHKQAEADRLNAERERIEAEAKAKAEREAEAKLALERQRIETEARAKAEEAQAQAKRVAFLAEASKSAGTRAIEAIQARKAASLGCGACVDGCSDEPKGCHVAESSPPLPEDDGSRVKLGQINALIAPFNLTADGLAQLGFVHVDTEKSAKLYRECDLPAIAMASAQHFQAIAERLSAEQLATA